MNDDELFNAAEEPPLRQQPNDRERESKFTPTYHCQSEEGSTTHDLRIIEIPTATEHEDQLPKNDRRTKARTGICQCTPVVGRIRL